MSILWQLITLDYYTITMHHIIYHIFTTAVLLKIIRLCVPHFLAMRNVI